MSKNIYDIAQTIRELMDADWENNEESLSSQMKNMKETFLKIVCEVNNPHLLQKVLELDAELIMPVDLIKATYERLLQIKKKDRNLWRNYAHYLLLHGPNWDEEANKILVDLESS